MTSSKSELSAFTNLVNSGQVRHSRRDFLRVSAVSAAAATSLAGVFSSPAMLSAHLQDASTESSPVTLRLPFNPYGQEVSVDPHRAVNWGPFWVMLPYAWSGLLRFDENGAVEADLAESVQPNENGSVWTATLREGIAFADGTPILAEHVLQSWNRALDSTRLSPMFRFLEPIVNAAELSSGENVTLGAIATDERTIEITLNAPLAHFPSFLATFGYAVVHPEIDTEGDGAIEFGNACSGPWSVTDVSDSEITMVPNPHHWSAPPQEISELVWAIAPSGATDATVLDWFRNNAVAVADAPPGVLSSLPEDDSIREELRRFDTQSSTITLALDFHQAPFNDVRVRRAVASAINKETWATEIEQGNYLPAAHFTPPVLATIAEYSAPSDTYQDDVTALLDEAGFNAEEFNEQILFFQPATDSDDAIARTAQLIDMIVEATGIQITHDTALTPEQITAARQDGGGLQMSLVQWQLDSDQPSLLSVMAQDSPYNAGWVNWQPELEDSGDYTPGTDAAAFDELVASASTILDATERNAAYADAEALLLKNAVLIPLGFWNPAYLQKSWLQGTRQGPWSGSTPVRIDSEVTVDMAGLTGTPDPAE